MMSTLKYFEVVVSGHAAALNMLELIDVEGEFEGRTEL